MAPSSMESHVSTNNANSEGRPQTQYTTGKGGGVEGQRNANGGEKRRHHQSNSSQQNRRGKEDLERERELERKGKYM